MNCPICDTPYKQEHLIGVRKGASCLGNFPYVHCVQQEWHMLYFGGLKPPRALSLHCLVTTEDEIATVYFKYDEPDSIVVKNGEEETIEVKNIKIDWKTLPILIRSIKSNLAFI